MISDIRFDSDVFIPITCILVWASFVLISKKLVEFMKENLVLIK